MFLLVDVIVNQRIIQKFRSAKRFLLVQREVGCRNSVNRAVLLWIYQWAVVNAVLRLYNIRIVSFKYARKRLISIMYLQLTVLMVFHLVKTSHVQRDSRTRIRQNSGPAANCGNSTS